MKKDPDIESVRLDRKNLSLLTGTCWAKGLLQMIIVEEKELSEEDERKSQFFIVA